jgi:hypothetical protein
MTVTGLPRRNMAMACASPIRGNDSTQLELGHLDRVRGIREALPPGIFVVGSAFDGVGVSDLARAAEETAAQVLAYAGAPWKEPA